MIEINLLPGAGRKKAATTRASIDWAAMTAGITARFGNPYLVAAIASVVVVLATVGILYLKQGSDRGKAEARLQAALDDSTRFSGIVEARVRLEAKRDTLLRQVNLIHAADEDRYIWAHVLDEVSRALPAYTWLTRLEFTGTPMGTQNLVAMPKAVPPDTTKHGPIKVPKLPTAIPKEEVQFRITGRTVDIQALTRYMRDLAQSPFVGAVKMDRADPGVDQGKDVYEFVLTLNYRRPDTLMLRRIPLVVTVR